MSQQSGISLLLVRLGAEVGVMEKARVCPQCGSAGALRGKCRQCGTSLASDAVELSGLSDSEVLRQILVSVRSIRAMVLFFVVLTIIGLIAQLVLFGGP